MRSITELIEESGASAGCINDSEPQLRRFARLVLLEAAEIAMNAHVPFACEEGEVCAAEAIQRVAEGLCA